MTALPYTDDVVVPSIVAHIVYHLREVHVSERLSVFETRYHDLAYSVWGLLQELVKIEHPAVRVLHMIDGEQAVVMVEPARSRRLSMPPPVTSAPRTDGVTAAAPVQSLPQGLV